MPNEEVVKSAVAPNPTSFSHLHARDRAGWLVIATVITMNTLGVWLSMGESFWLWSIGQAVLALALLQWFVILHEAGHNTLFRTRGLNRVAGHLASVFALIPFNNWKFIHGRHHKYTGWQDLDATTALLVPREIMPWERVLMNFAWSTGLPLFSVLYRIQNFWNLSRVAHYLERAENVRTSRFNTLILALLYLIAVAAIGPMALLSSAGIALLLCLMAQDVILLSQHTHMPTNLSRGAHVRTFPPLHQEQFTRSLRLPEWLSRLLLRFDMHELHHMYVQVPGYDLHRIPYAPQNQVSWLDWTREAKRLRGTEFLFSSREKTEFRR